MKTVSIDFKSITEKYKDIFRDVSNNVDIKGYRSKELREIEKKENVIIHKISPLKKSKGIKAVVYYFLETNENNMPNLYATLIPK